jgi:hypothetical protein
MATHSLQRQLVSIAGITNLLVVAAHSPDRSGSGKATGPGSRSRSVAVAVMAGHRRLRLVACTRLAALKKGIVVRPFEVAPGGNPFPAPLEGAVRVSFRPRCRWVGWSIVDGHRSLA